MISQLVKIAAHFQLSLTVLWKLKFLPILGHQVNLTQTLRLVHMCSEIFSHQSIFDHSCYQIVIVWYQENIHIYPAAFWSPCWRERLFMCAYRPLQGTGHGGVGDCYFCASIYIYTLNLKLLPRTYIYLYSISSFVKGGWWGCPTPSFWVDNIVFAFRICLPHHGQLLRSNEPSPKKTPGITPAGILLSRPSPSFPIALHWPIHICSHALIINPVGKTKLPPPLSFKSLFQWICSLPNLNSWF